MINNYDRLMRDMLRRMKERSSLMLHVCCAPCASQVLERLDPYFDITCFFYNPNIYPPAEYEARLNEVKRLLTLLPLSQKVRLIEGKYDPDRWFGLVKGHEADPECGGRCSICFEERLRETLLTARECGCDYFASSLTNGPKKNAAVINTIGFSLEDGVRWLPNDFKKKGGFDRSLALSEEYGLYRQDTCGCIFSGR